MASFLLMPEGGSRLWEPEGPGNARGWSSCHGISRDKGTKLISSNPTSSPEPTWPTHSHSLPSSPGYSTWFSSLGRFCSELPVSSFLLDRPRRRPGSLLSAPSFIQTQGRQRGGNRGSGITHSHRTPSGYAGHLDTPVWHRGERGCRIPTWPQNPQMTCFYTELWVPGWCVLIGMGTDQQENGKSQLRGHWEQRTSVSSHSPVMAWRVHEGCWNQRECFLSQPQKYIPFP